MNDAVVDGLASHTLANHAEWFGQLIDALDLKELIFVGQDWGGAIGTLALADRAERMAGLVLLNTAVTPPKVGRFAVPGPDVLKNRNSPPSGSPSTDSTPGKMVTCQSVLAARSESGTIRTSFSVALYVNVKVSFVASESREKLAGSVAVAGLSGLLN